MNSVVIVLLGYLTVLVVLCNNCTAQYFPNQTRDFHFLRGELEALTRQSRFLQFETINEDLKVALEFIFPFLHIPVKSTTDVAASMTKNVANLNLGVIAFTGATVLAGVSAAFGLTHLMKAITGKKSYSKDLDATQYNKNSFNKRYHKSMEDQNETPIAEILANIEAVFKEYDIDITTCVQKTICLLIQESAKKVSRGIGTSTNKIVDGLTGMNWLLTFLSGTAVRDAIDSGRSNIHCGLKYQQCTWSDNGIKDFIHNM